ncbi:hypothetical protein RN001_010734 [Aquatica leii]|uniref:Protein DP71L n=1 Tax=Aquatica leii TaxID=1421715 RepID=A0AAN7P880_9COLE|nr:hypothetical protein RN001_010734 [Aquatica leii]
MGSQKLPSVTKTLDFNNMKQGYLKGPLDLFSRLNFSVFNSNKTFDYSKQAHDSYTPNCHRVDIVCNNTAPQIHTMTPTEAPKKHKQSRKKRNKKRRGTKHQKHMGDKTVRMDDHSVGASSAVVDGDTVDGCLSPRRVNFRCRLPSECESEDSFIVFEDESNCFGDDRHSDGSETDTNDTECSFQDQSDAGCDNLTTKMVRFADAEQLCEIHPMIKWSYAYRKARKGPWEQHALDRMRFQNRINNAKLVLDYVLQPAHRSQIYKDRFKE